MKRYRLIYRGKRDTYYCFDTQTKKRESLKTNNADEAQRLIDIKNEAVRNTAMNLQIAQVYLKHSDSALSARTWQTVMDQMTPLKSGATQTLLEKRFQGLSRLSEVSPARGVGEKAEEYEADYAYAYKLLMETYDLTQVVGGDCGARVTVTVRGVPAPPPLPEWKE